MNESLQGLDVTFYVVVPFHQSKALPGHIYMIHAFSRWRGGIVWYKTKQNNKLLWQKLKRALTILGLFRSWQPGVTHRLVGNPFFFFNYATSNIPLHLVPFRSILLEMRNICFPTSVFAVWTLAGNHYMQKMPIHQSDNRFGVNRSNGTIWTIITLLNLPLHRLKIRFFSFGQLNPEGNQD